VGVSWEALRSSEISLFDSLHGEASQKTLIFILFIQFLLQAYCTMFLFVINYCSDMFRPQFVWPSSRSSQVCRLVSLTMGKNCGRNMLQQ
jgi:hypothetical protein